MIDVKLPSEPVGTTSTVVGCVLWKEHPILGLSREMSKAVVVRRHCLLDGLAIR